MTRTIALASLLLISAPALSEHRPAALLDMTYGELAALRADIDQIPHRGVQRQLDTRVDRIEGLLVRLEQTGALDARRGMGPQRPQAPPPPPALTYEEALHMVRVETFDRGKLEAIHRAARNGRFTTAEARALASELTFDSGKADALIALYPVVVDPHRYAMTLDILTFSSSRTRVAQTLGL